MLIFLYIICLIGSGVYLFLIWNYKHWAKRGIPFPKPQIPSGNLPSLFTQKQHIAYDYENIYKQFKDQYSLVGFFNVRLPQYLVLDANIAKEVLISKFKNFRDNEFADMVDKEKDPIFGNNPFMLKGEEWKEKRAEITPAFTQHRIKAMYPVIEDVCETMKKFIIRENGQAIDAREMSANFTTDVVSSCIFGVDAEALSGTKSPIRQMGQKVIGSDTAAKFMFYFFVVQLIPSIKKIYKISIVEKIVEKFFITLMKDAIDLRKKSKVNRVDYLNYLLELQQKKNLSELQMVAHAIAFFLDGFDTSSVVLCSALNELAKNTDVQEKLRCEIEEYTERYEKITFDAIQEMPYLEQVFSETLRLYPPAVFLSKMCTDSCELPLNENKMIPVEKGYCIVIPVYSIHRDPRYFEDAEKFIPERFAPEVGGTKIHREKGSFLPFGDGPRICLGMRFAQIQLKAAIVSIVRNFEISLDERTSKDVVLDPKDFLPIPIGGIWLKFKEINHK